MSDFMRHNASSVSFNTSESWVILSPIELSIKRKIESVGVPLKDWDINIYRGVLTGYNEAFIISTDKRNEILANCKNDEEHQRTEELIRPILRGRDIKRYGYDWADLWLINTHNGIKGKLDRIRIEDYPAVKTHLDQYWDKISTRTDKGDTPYNLRNCAYLDDFNKPKIVWASVGKTEYSIIPKEYVLLDTNYFIAIDKYANIIAFLNSDPITWWICNEDTQIGEGGAYRHYKYNLEKLRIPQSGVDFSANVNAILAGREVEYNIALINKCIFRYYSFTQEEVNYISSWINDKL